MLKWAPMSHLTNPADRNFKSAETVVMFSYTANIHLVLKQLFLCVIINGADRFLKKKKKNPHTSFKIFSFTSGLKEFKKFTTF